MRNLTLVSFVFLTACARDRNPAPEDLDGITQWLFQWWETDTEVVDAMTNLAPWLETDAQTEEASEGFVMSDLTEEVVAEVEHADEDFERLIGVATPWVSPFPIEEHAALLVLEDQTWAEPGTYETYTRALAEGDAETFPTGTGIIRTVNDIDKKGAFGVNIPYILYKNYRWATLEDGRRAVVARSWLEEVSCAEGGKNCLHMSFSIDLFFENTPDETVRMTCSWNDLRTEADAFLTDAQRVGLMVNGMTDVFVNTDEVLAGEQ